MPRRILATLLVILSTATALAWNGLGHKVIADIAWRQLDEAKRAEIVATLRRHPRFDEDFAKGMPAVTNRSRWVFQHAATWPDQIRGNPDFDMPTWHYVNFSEFVGDERPVTFNREIEPTGDRTQWNIMPALAYNRDVIASDAPPQDKAIAYCWLFHLVGDLHQPLHALSPVCDKLPGGDRSGNSIPVAQGRNLHAVWDGLLGGRNRPNDVKRALVQLEAHRDWWNVGTKVGVPTWAAESHALCLSLVYSPEILSAVQQPGALTPINLPEAYLKSAGDTARLRVVAAVLRFAALLTVSETAALSGPSNLPQARIDGTGLGWRELAEADFANVNCAPSTWMWKDGTVHCSGQPVGVIRSKKAYTNFELVAQWRHLRSGGNSGIFVWTAEAALKDLEPGSLPRGGIEVQVLDHGYTAQYETSSGKKADWFTTHGDVFPVGTAKMSPFPPTSPNGERSFPRKQLSKGVGEWNHYYIRCLNGEVRLWVNGEEVSGAAECEPRAGYLCLESEGAPVDFRGLRIRELP